ncbi:ribosomal protein S3 [Spirochaeta thermophila DSM 6578]|uniref:Small ribosomal subunit protein uS3 n=1 Tax=Winmispira thermophila (strain ATCC 700085 / DSM 6578 / Z-1203) TaxID=869211 RepID=G0GFA5_WINT7|nr:30S ribosomal protein S3 [Spirochaeta thermophila]AEJ60804.1 ribosomal protein S3 [Spirochaeta thermophila DSM 6578]
MGQKVNPYGLRLGINKTWKSKWFVDLKDYAKVLHEDLLLRKRLLALPEAKAANVGDVEIIRHPQRVMLVVHTPRPGVLIGAKGATIERIGAELQKMVSKKLQIKIKEIKRPEAHAQVVAQNIAGQLEHRASFRRVMKLAVANAMKAGVQGIKVRVSGRLGGAEIARSEVQMAGRVPLHTLRADIDYGFAEARTTYGVIGVKVWIFHGETFGKAVKQDAGTIVTPRRENRSRRRS